MKILNLALSAALLVAPMAVSAAEVADANRQKQCSITYFANTILMAVLADEGSTATAEQKTQFNDLAAKMGSKAMKLSAVTDIEKIPEDVKTGAMSQLEAALKLPEGKGLLQLVDDSKACDAEFGL
jgi:hypothetical protein